MGFIGYIILGALAGWIVSLILKTNKQQGAWGNIVVGVIGALVGGWLGSALFGVKITGLNISSLLIAIIGGLLFAIVLGMVTGKKSV